MSPPGETGVALIRVGWRGRSSPRTGRDNSVRCVSCGPLALFWSRSRVTESIAVGYAWRSLIEAWGVTV
jgi:hypothetical protein